MHLQPWRHGGHLGDAEKEVAESIAAEEALHAFLRYLLEWSAGIFRIREKY